MLTAMIAGKLLLPPKHTLASDATTGVVYDHVNFPLQTDVYDPGSRTWDSVILQMHLYNEIAVEARAKLSAGATIAVHISNLWPSYTDHGDTLAQYINCDVSALELLDPLPARPYQPQGAYR